MAAVIGLFPPRRDPGITNPQPRITGLEKPVRGCHYVVVDMDVGYCVHLMDLLVKLYRKQLAKVKVAGTLSDWFRVKVVIQLQ